MFTKKFKLLANILLILAVFLPACVFATTEPETVPEKAAIIERLGDKLDPEIRFKDELGNDVKLGDYLGKGKPILLTPVYFECPALCTHTLNGLLNVLDEIELAIGKDFTILSFSINPRETPKLAADKKEVYLKELKALHNGRDGWHFLTTSEDQIKAMTQAIGFQFFPDKNEFAHSAALMVLTETGIVSRYLYGIVFPEEHVRLSLVEASEGKIGSTFDHIYLYCFRFDPTKGQYTLAVMNLVRVISIGFVIFLVIFLWKVYKRSEASRARDDLAN